MNTLIANQYGQVQGEVGGKGLTLAVAAQTPRRESVHLETRIDLVEQQLYLLAILKAVERRIEQFQLRDSNAPQVDLLLRDELSLSVSLNVSSHGLCCDVQTPLWQSQFAISKANDVATLAVFMRRAANQEKVIPLRFGDETNHLSLRKRNDGQVIAEFQHQNSGERIPLSTLQVYELEILAQYVLHRAFEPNPGVRGQLPPQSVTAAQIA